MSELGISESEWKAELDNSRGNRKFTMTEEQFKFVSYARQGNPPVTWSRINEIWFNKMCWKKMTRNTLAEKYMEYIKQH